MKPNCVRYGTRSRPMSQQRPLGFRCSTSRWCGRTLGRRRKRGPQDEALGRSRGGFSTKIHLKVDLDGRPLAFHLTEGQASDSPQFENPARPGTGHHAASRGE